jgi:O-6-methylguanine DNA methyltransferase
MPYVEEPALEALNEEQLRGCVWFAKLIQRGAVDLAKLNKQSLALEENSKPGRKGRDNDIAVPGASADARSASARKAASRPPQTPTTAALLSRIARSSQTAFQKRTLSALLQIPRGHHTTYAILARHLKSSPRAVGNALSANPFAPHVPCHRVLASDGGIGGFKGVWGRHGQQGANDDEKRRLLRSEGVVFDARGRALGSSWEAFR